MGQDREMGTQQAACHLSSRHNRKKLVKIKKLSRLWRSESAKEDGSWHIHPSTPKLSSKASTKDYTLRTRANQKQDDRWPQLVDSDVPIHYLPVRKKLKFFLEEDSIVQNPYFFQTLPITESKRKITKHSRKEEHMAENQKEKEDNRSRSEGIQLFELLSDIVINTD